MGGRTAVRPPIKEKRIITRRPCPPDRCQYFVIQTDGEAQVYGPALRERGFEKRPLDFPHRSGYSEDRACFFGP